MTQERMSAAEAGADWRIDLPWPPAALSPNARLNWRAAHRKRHSYRHTCAWTCVDQKVRKIEAERVKATIIFSPPDARRRDIDNMLASIKAAIDAVAEAIGIDDSKWAIELCRGLPRKGGNVRIVLEAA
jgi:crossover junction endodeoxyribonuclease RusA